MLPVVYSRNSEKSRLPLLLGVGMEVLLLALFATSRGLAWEGGARRALLHSRNSLENMVKAADESMHDSDRKGHL